MKTPIDRLLLRILKIAARDYLKDRDQQGIVIFFASNWFEDICGHFDSQPDEVVDQLAMYKAYYLRHRLNPDKIFTTHEID